MSILRWFNKTIIGCR